LAASAIVTSAFANCGHTKGVKKAKTRKALENKSRNFTASIQNRLPQLS
jgi:hypothetical protein